MAVVRPHFRTRRRRPQAELGSVTRRGLADVRESNVGLRWNERSQEISSVAREQPSRISIACLIGNGC